MKFEIFGPFEVKLDRYGNIPASSKEFWAGVEKQHEGLSSARGCYLFCVGTSGTKRVLPWYIGKTNKQSFQGECFKPHQRTHYSRALNHYKRCKAYLYLVGHRTNGGKFSKNRAPAVISFVETYLIGFGLWANYDLLNKRDTKLYRDLVIPGLLNGRSGNPGAAATRLKESLYMDKV